MKKTLMAWSGGKDSALALYEIQKKREFEITALLTTVTEDYDRISMHGVRRILLEKQAKSLGYPLEIVNIPKKCDNRKYQARMKASLERYIEKGVSCVVFGDIYLEDVRKYRERNLSKVGMQGVFPLWKRNTRKLARNFIDLGFKAVVTCVDSKVLNKKFCGMKFNNGFLLELPSGVDPCGENGEFHTFVHDGSIFKKKIRFRKGKVVLRDNRFYFCDLLPAGKTA
jgi:uncharacterized protein (TIGR00290 family)